MPSGNIAKGYGMNKLLTVDGVSSVFELIPVVTFRVFGKPIPKGNHSAFVRGNRAIITDSYGGNLSHWQDLIRTAAVNAYDWTEIFKTYSGAVAVGMDFFFKHPQNHWTISGNRSKNYRDIYIKAPDADKLTRAVFDALTGTVYDDDNRAFIEHAAKWYGQEGVIVTIYLAKEKINELI